MAGYVGFGESTLKARGDYSRLSPESVNWPNYGLLDSGRRVHRRIAFLRLPANAARPVRHNWSLPEHLQAVGITKRYDGVYALKSASFSLRAGEVHALVGENGAGKSTLARILAGSTRADSGAISIHGAPVEIATPLDAQRLGIGIIYQELDLFPNLTAGENIVIGEAHRSREGRLADSTPDLDRRRGSDAKRT